MCNAEVLQFCAIRVPSRKYEDRPLESPKGLSLGFHRGKTRRSRQTPRLLPLSGLSIQRFWRRKTPLLIYSMHMAMPTRKSSTPQPYTPRWRGVPTLRRSRAKAIVLGLCALATVLFTISHIFGSSESIPSGTPPVVIITVLDSDHYSRVYLDTIEQNRNHYAKKHGE